MTMGVFDFKAIANKLNCNEQKAEFEEKNPKPADIDMLSGHLPEWGYGASMPFSDEARLEFYQMYGLGYQGDTETVTN